MPKKVKFVCDHFNCIDKPDVLRVAKYGFKQLNPNRCKHCKVIGMVLNPKKYCVHGRRRTECRDCGGVSICEHGRRRRLCKECRGASICEHDRVRSQCKDCGGSQICEHGRRRDRCKDCTSTRRMFD